MTEPSGRSIKELKRKMLNQNKLEKLENRKNLLVRNIQLCKNYKERTIRFVQRLNNQYSLGLISHEEHYSRLSNALKQRTPEQWTKYFDDYARYYEYQLSKCEKEIRKEERKSQIAPVIAISIVLMILGAGLFFLKPTTTGYATIAKETSYNQTIGEMFTANSEYSWFLEHPAELKSIRLSGKISKNGYAQVYLSQNGIKYIIFDSNRLREEGIIDITGLVIWNETNQTATIINEAIINETASSNETGIIVINETIINETAPINETINQTITNETIINETESSKNISKIIKIALEYKPGTAYDINDDGIETTTGVIDFTAENSKFNWNLNFDKLCAKWEVYSVEGDETTTVCYGSDKCCS